MADALQRVALAAVCFHAAGHCGQLPSGHGGAVVVEGVFVASVFRFGASGGQASLDVGLAGVADSGPNCILRLLLLLIFNPFARILYLHLNSIYLSLLLEMRLIPLPLLYSPDLLRLSQRLYSLLNAFQIQILLHLLGSRRVPPRYPVL